MRVSCKGLCDLFVCTWVGGLVGGWVVVKIGMCLLCMCVCVCTCTLIHSFLVEWYHIYVCIYIYVCVYTGTRRADGYSYTL